jgi:hypothetical protein
MKPNLTIGGLSGRRRPGNHRQGSHVKGVDEGDWIVGGAGPDLVRRGCFPQFTMAGAGGYRRDGWGVFGATVRTAARRGSPQGTTAPQVEQTRSPRLTPPQTRTGSSTPRFSGSPSTPRPPSSSCTRTVAPTLRRVRGSTVVVAAHAVQHIGNRAAVTSVKVGAPGWSFGVLEIEVAGGIDAVDALAVAFQLTAFETLRPRQLWPHRPLPGDPRPGPLRRERAAAA